MRGDQFRARKLIHKTDQLPTAARVEEHRVGRTYGEHLLWLAFILTAIEFIYANVLVRGGKSAPDKVSVDAAGHVETRAHATAEA